MNIKGTKSWKASVNTIRNINQLFKQFTSLASTERIADDESLPIESFVETIYRQAKSTQSIQRVDFNTGNPVSLYNFRIML